MFWTVLGHAKAPTPISLTPEDRKTLESRVSAPRSEVRQVQRARIVLLADEGLSNNEIADQLRVGPNTVSKWRCRFAAEGIAGLEDAPRTGPPRRYGPETEQRVLEVLKRKPPKGYSKWNGPLVSEALGDVTVDQVWRILRTRRISLARRHSWCVSTDPEFAPKAADIVGLYLAPPRNAVVICVDEKPHIQALERAQGYLRMPDGRALCGYAHDYKRHGTTTLFAALNTVTGEVQAGHYKRRRRREFLDFMNEVVACFPGKEIHVILDNLNTHKPKEDRWLRRHANVHFHFTATHASWLNQIEVWFLILSRSALKGASFTCPLQVRKAIDDFVAVWNENAAPFEWTKEEVGVKRLNDNIADLRD